ncbi:helix-turn-helix domain-containing protein [Clostridium sulfidigenes]|uniref:helix-turn-helix domain-containing protein n=1 Tax=Clostridium sulfidigenes TaxID=318464 RepID=UPI003F888AA6
MLYFVRLKNFREDRDLTQVEISEILNIDQRVYSNYETGKRKIPINHLITLAKLYNTSIDYLVNLTDDPKPYLRK